MEEAGKKMLAVMEEETINKLAERYNLNAKEASNYIKKESVSKRGRPKNVGGKEPKKVKGARGRPPKEEKPETSYVGEDLIARLIEAARKKAGM